MPLVSGFPQVSGFLENAARILETAELGDGGPVTILLRDGRPISLTVENDWSLDALRRERGADEAFRVSRKNGKLFVEGRSHDRACLLAGNRPADAVRALLTPGWAAHPACV
ncbi:MAG: hypothetical protein SFV18_14355 [Bryobacteraceae bacterium]|jgi:hypothetical protein|nr:hypothetical protein [Bryobacteraceae bacterium]